MADTAVSPPDGDATIGRNDEVLQPRRARPPRTTSTATGGGAVGTAVRVGEVALEFDMAELVHGAYLT
jgi:hypothetical protein